MKHLLFLFCLIWGALDLSAEEVKKISLSFCKDQFDYVTYNNGTLAISSKTQACGFGENLNEPGLPLIPINVYIPNGYTYVGVNEEVSKKLLYDNVVVAPNPKFVPTDCTEKVWNLPNPDYKEAKYPLTNVEYVATSIIDGYTVLRFLVCPFEYDTQNRRLYLIDKENLNISIAPLNSTSTQANSHVGGNMSELVKNTIINVKDFEDEAEIVQFANISISQAPISLSYVIITSNDLAESFKPLARWKMMKGVKSKIVTVNDVRKKYPSAELRLAIKKYLYDLYKNEGLTYVLMGGDDTIIPARYCYTYITKETNNGVEEEYIPTPADLYYACFGEDFTWNANENHRYGELEDNIVMDPSILVTRIPVRSADDVSAFVNRIIEYEQNPTGRGWSNSILMAGNKGFQINGDGQSDAEVNGNTLYTSSIQPYWNGTRKRLYDTFTDFTGGASYALNWQNLQSQLQKGYTFMDMNTHGSKHSWTLESGSYYTDSEASTLKNKGYTIITTDACDTNAFDEYAIDPCLSEAFIRNADSGILAYFGSSRKGWGDYYKPFSGGPSLEYEKQFYKSVLSGGSPKSFGYAVAEAKQAMIGLCKSYNTYRWLQFALNPIGDPEMPIYTSVPQKFNMANISVGLNGSLMVNAGVAGCTICLMSVDDMGESLYDKRMNVQSATFYPGQSNVSVCITKSGYQPCVYYYGIVEENANAIDKCVLSTSNNTLTVHTNIAESVNDANILVSSANGDKIYKHKVSRDNAVVVTDMSQLGKGVYTVSLIVDGHMVDSKSILKKK